MPEIPNPSGKAPEIAKLDNIIVPPDFESFTEATIKYETPRAREARDVKLQMQPMSGCLRCSS